MWSFSRDGQERDVLLWTQGICCKQNCCIFFYNAIIPAILAVETWGATELDVYTKVPDLSPEKLFRKQKNRHRDGTETDPNPGFGGGRCRALDLQLVYTL